MFYKAINENILHKHNLNCFLNNDRYCEFRIIACKTKLMKRNFREF